MVLSSFGPAVLLFSGLAFSEVLTTIDPCPGAPENIPQLHQPITVTQQHQAVPTCTRNDKSFGWSSYDWVSTVIPCWGEGSISSCTVTKTDQIVPCSGAAKTITSLVTKSTPIGDNEYSTHIDTKYVTISKEWAAPYNEIGPFAIPGYGGCELCKDCGSQADGNKKQSLGGIECAAASGKKPVCFQFKDVWTSSAAPSTSGRVSAVVSKHTYIPSAGKYTFTFPQPAPSTVIVSRGHRYTIPARPWAVTVTKSFHRPQNYVFHVTATKTVFFNVPYHTHSRPAKTRIPETAINGHWRHWGHPPMRPPHGFGPHHQGKPWHSTATPITMSGNSQSPNWGNWGSVGGNGDNTYTSSMFSSTTASTSMTMSGDPIFGTTSATSTSSTSSTAPGFPGSTSSTTSTSSTASGSPGSSTSTTSTSSTTSNSTSTTMTMTGTTITTTSSTTSTTITPSATPSTFFIQVTFTGTRKRYVKRADEVYVGFLDGSDDASVVSASQNPASFYFDTDGYLRTGTYYITGDTTSGYFVFERSTQRPDNPPPYTISGGSLIYTGGGSFCATSTNLFVTISSSPSNCRAVSLGITSDVTTTSTTTTTISATTSTESATTTTTADVSADLDAPDPTPFVRRMKY